ncbi:hypothetical protein C8R45DRAFT_924045 [Mycena sanguinolenta]|nr:hypothetical protein C8R45DRAFT_924045 [Mycena sanguinolenta]
MNSLLRRDEEGEVWKVRFSSASIMKRHIRQRPYCFLSARECEFKMGRKREPFRVGDAEMDAAQDSSQDREEVYEFARMKVSFIIFWRTGILRPRHFLEASHRDVNVKSLMWLINSIVSAPPHPYDLSKSLKPPIETSITQI